jgi:hypothetical protein
MQAMIFMPAAGLAGLDIDIEHTLESLCPRHGGALLGGCFVGLCIGPD